MLSNENTVLVVVRISNWNGHRYDKDASQRTLMINNSDQNAGRFNKRLLPKSALIDIKKTIQDFQKYVDKNTIAYSGLTATQILPISSFIEFQKNVTDYRSRLKKDLQALMETYLQHIEQAKVMLGKMFKDSDYPDVEDLMYKFFIGVNYMPVPESDNFNALVGNTQVAALNRQITNVTEAAAEDLLFKTYTVLHRLHESLLSPSDRYFKTTVVTNIEHIVNQLSTMSYLGDPLLLKIHAHVKAHLMGIDINKLKAAESYCKKLAAQTQVGIDMISKHYDFS